MNNILLVYNICQKDKDNTDHYINSIRSILNQNNFNDTHKIVVSACKNRNEALNRLLDEFRDKINIVYYDDIYTVNITFNKTIQEYIKRFGKFNGYVYIDSGIIFTDPNIINTFSELLNQNLYSMITIQVDKDNGFDMWLGFNQIIGNNYIVPIGKACNLHCQLFTNELYETYNRKIIPDIFAAFCTESTFSFMNAAINKKWVIAKDIIVYHKQSLDDASMYFQHKSERFDNFWNNLLFNRNANDFINDPEAIEAGFGYEEVNNIMFHKKDMFDENGFSKDPEKLKKIIIKYLYLNEQELDYDKIRTVFM